MLLWIGLLAIAQADRTTFQTSQPFRPSIAIPADAAVVYGFGNDMPGRVKSWKDQGYTVQLMTGVAWGQYQDYLYGRFDGINHVDEAQTNKDGNKISHGGDVYYMSPGPSYGKFLAAGVRKALDVGVDSIYLEEPEFWVRAGYSPAFKREWQDFYHEAWQAPDSSAEAQWRASKLKYFLYRRALQQVFDDVQLYNKEHNRNVHCYVATHSLLNYSSWSIVSPESSLAQLKGCDGYIAQVWTGTARTPNYYQGELKERTFQTAYLEYGAMMNVARATRKRLWFLADPVEDDPKHDWGDYKRNYEATVTASLLQPDVANYEVMPWPERIFEGQYPTEADPKVKAGIPPAYATELQLIDNALSNMEAQKDVKWTDEFPGIGVVVSDTLMFERSGPTPSDQQLGHIYGLALPLLNRGFAVQPVQLETATKDDLAKQRILLMTYRGMKPMTPESDAKLAKWVESGGLLIFVDDDGDPFNNIREWWNTGGKAFKTPREALFRKLHIKEENGFQEALSGGVVWLHKNPAELAKSKNGDEELMRVVRNSFRQMKGYFPESRDFFELKRGMYVITAKLNKSAEIPTQNRAFVNLYDPELKLQEPGVASDEMYQLLVDVQNIREKGIHLLALAGKTLESKESSASASYEITGIEGTNGIALLKCPTKPASVNLNGNAATDTTYDAKHHLLWVRFVNSAKPRTLEVRI
ncbi:MAG TPA: hypothetical protein VGL56_11050 [Fimbriimonadaceae bacterium]|jgi:hypothetical protein